MLRFSSPLSLEAFCERGKDHLTLQLPCLPLMILALKLFLYHLYIKVYCEESYLQADKFFSRKEFSARK